MMSLWLKLEIVSFLIINIAIFLSHSLALSLSIPLSLYLSIYLPFVLLLRRECSGYSTDFDHTQNSCYSQCVCA